MSENNHYINKVVDIVMDESLSRSFVYSSFRNYYNSSSFSVPSIPSFSQREFGIFDYHSKKMVRHLGFKTKTDLKKFLGKKYYSRYPLVA